MESECEVHAGSVRGGLAGASSAATWLGSMHTSSTLFMRRRSSYSVLDTNMRGSGCSACCRPATMCCSPGRRSQRWQRSTAWLPPSCQSCGRMLRAAAPTATSAYGRSAAPLQHAPASALCLAVRLLLYSVPGTTSGCRAGARTCRAACSWCQVPQALSGLPVWQRLCSTLIMRPVQKEEKQRGWQFLCGYCRMTRT